MEHSERGAAQGRRRGIGDQRREQALREPHVRAPEHDAGEECRQRRERGDHQVGGDQRDEAPQQQMISIALVGGEAGPVGSRAISQVNHHEDHRHQGERHAEVLGAQHQECLREAR